jgi:hypothetical protein
MLYNDTTPVTNK